MTPLGYRITRVIIRAVRVCAGAAIALLAWIVGGWPRATFATPLGQLSITDIGQAAVVALVVGMMFLAAYGTAFGDAPEPSQEYARLQDTQNEQGGGGEPLGWDSPLTLRGVTVGAAWFAAFALVLWLVDLTIKWSR